MDGLISRLAVPALLAALALAGWQWGEATQALAETAAVRAEFAGYQATQERQTREALQQQLADKASTDKSRQEALDAEYLARIAAQADAGRAAAAAERLRQRAAQLAAASHCGAAADTAAAPGSPAASTPADLLAHMLGRIDQAAGDIGEFAEASHRASQLCAGVYIAVRQTNSF